MLPNVEACYKANLEKIAQPAPHLVIGKAVVDWRDAP